jgi:hypothetical protein
MQQRQGGLLGHVVPLALPQQGAGQGVGKPCSRVVDGTTTVNGNT